MRTKVVGFVLALLLSSVLIGQQSKQAEIDLQAAIRAENVNGPKTAIKQYEAIAHSYEGIPSVAARALLRLGQAYERIGDTNARGAYERIGQKYGSQTEIAAEAARRLKALDRVGKSETPVDSLVPMDDRVGAARHVFITPDGQFLSMRTSSNVTMVRNLMTGQSEQFLPEDAEAAMMSPDGRHIALVRAHEQGRDYEVLVRDNRPNSKPVVVLEANTEAPTPYLAGWSMDGKSILLTASRNDQTWEIDLLSVADRSLKRIVSLGWRYMGDRPSLSPDGRYIAYAALSSNPAKPTGRFPVHSIPPDTGGQSIYVVAVDGSSQDEVKGTTFNESPVWTRDGSHILFVSDRSGTFGLYSVAVQNGKVKGKLSPVKGVTIAERIEPVGMTSTGSYYYIRNRSGTDVFQSEIGPDGKVQGRPVRVSDNGVNHNTGAVWAPDGKRIAFMRERSGTRNVVDLVIRDEDSEETIFELPSGTSGRAPLWMHDGKSLLLQASGIYRFDLESKESTLVYDVASTSSLSVSPDDQTLYLTPDRQSSRIVSFDLRTSKQRNIWVSPASTLVDSFVLSPDGRSLAITTYGGNNFAGDQGTRLARVNIDGTGLLPLASGVWHSPTFTPDGKAILYLDDSANLMRIPANGGSPQAMGLTMPYFNGFGLKPTDGSQILFTDDAPREIWKLDNLSSALEN